MQIISARRALSLVLAVINAASTAAWLASLGVGSIMSGVTGWVANFPSPWRYPLLVGIFLLATGIALSGFDRVLPRENAAVGGGRWLLLNHRLKVLDAQLQRLHFLFTSARNSDGSNLDSIEQVYQLRDEPLIQAEIVDHPDLWRHFYDDTGFQQPTQGTNQRQIDLRNFLERRHNRLRELIADLRNRLQQEGG